MRKNTFWNRKNENYPTIINPWIPETPRHGYAVCRGVAKARTVPVPVTPVLESPRVYPYPCSTLSTDESALDDLGICGTSAASIVLLGVVVRFLITDKHSWVCISTLNEWKALTKTFKCKAVERAGQACLPHHSVRIYVRYVDNTMTLCRLRRPSGRPPDYT